MFFQIIFPMKKSKRKFVGGNPFKNNVSVHMRTPKFLELNASAYGKI